MHRLAVRAPCCDGRRLLRPRDARSTGRVAQLLLLCSRAAVACVCARACACASASASASASARVLMVVVRRCGSNTPYRCSPAGPPASQLQAVTAVTATLLLPHLSADYSKAADGHQDPLRGAQGPRVSQHLFGHKTDCARRALVRALPRIRRHAGTTLAVPPGTPFLHAAHPPSPCGGPHRIILHSNSQIPSRQLNLPLTNAPVSRRACVSLPHPTPTPQKGP